MSLRSMQPCNHAKSHKKRDNKKIYSSQIGHMVPPSEQAAQ